MDSMPQLCSHKLIMMWHYRREKKGQGIRGYDSASKIEFIIQTERWELSGCIKTQTSRKSERTPTRRDNPYASRHMHQWCIVSYSRIQETSKKIARKRIFPGSKSQPHPSTKPYRDRDVWYMVQRRERGVKNEEYERRSEDHKELKELSVTI